MSVSYNQLKQSKYVNKIVLLELDQVYSEDGFIQREATHLYVSNEYLAHLAQIYQGFLFSSYYPFPIVSLNKGKGLEEILDAFGWLAGHALPVNDFDKNYQLLKPHFSETTFTTAAHVLRNLQNPVPDFKRYLSRIGLKKRGIF